MTISSVRSKSLFCGLLDSLFVLILNDDFHYFLFTFSPRTQCQIQICPRIGEPIRIVQGKIAEENAHHTTENVRSESHKNGVSESSPFLPVRF